MKELHEREASTEKKRLHLSVETGGCTVFQNGFLLDDKTNLEDRFFIHPRSGVVCCITRFCERYNHGLRS